MIPQTSTIAVIRKVTVIIKRVKQLTLREMATQLGVPQSTIYSIIKIALQAKNQKQCNVYQLNAAQIEKVAIIFVASL